MGEPFLNIEEVKRAIQMIENRWPGTHHYVSTVGLKGSDFSWIQKRKHYSTGFSTFAK